MAIYKSSFTRAQIEEALNRALNVVTEGKSFTLKGEWVSGGSYANSASTIDVVIYDGVSYFCRVTHSGRSTNPKADTTYWGQLAGYEPLIKNVPQEDIDESDTIFFTDASDNGSTKRVTLANFTSKFPSGRGIASIERTSGTGAPGTTDTYTITYTDSTTSTLTVYNGADGQGAGDMLLSVYDPTGKNTDIFGYVDNKVKTDVPTGAKFTDTVYTHPASHPPSIIAQDASNRFVSDAEKSAWNSKAAGTHSHAQSDVTGLSTSLSGKVDKVTGKGLSTEDYTTTEKSKLAGIEAGAQVNTITSVAGKTGAVTLAKSDVGLGNVDNVKQMPIAGGTFTGVATAQSNTSYTTRQIRNFVLSTSDPSGGSNGDVWIKHQ